MQDFRDLLVWQRAHALTLDVYATTRAFPKEELYGIVSQLRRAAISVAANIAEGAKRRTSQDFARFLNMAQGSLGEVEYFCLLSRDLNLVTPDRYAALAGQIDPLARMLSTLRRKVEGSSPATRAS